MPSVCGQIESSLEPFSVLLEIELQKSRRAGEMSNCMYESPPRYMTCVAAVASGGPSAVRMPV